MTREENLPSECLTEREIIAFATGELDDEHLARAETHMADCGNCRESLALFMRITTEDPALDEESAALDEATRPAVLALIHEHTARERERSASENGPAPPTGNAARRAFPAWALAAAAAVLLAVGLYGVSTLRRHDYVDRSRSALAEASRRERPVEPRLSGLDYAPHVRVRGARDETASVERALANARAAVEEDPTPEALDARGRAMLASGRADEAIADFERALAKEPENAAIAVDAAAAAIERGAYDDAVARLDAVLAREPAREDALFNRALALQRAKRDDDARRAWARYLEVDPSSKWADEARANLDDLAK